MSKKAAFTMVELIFVIVILGILAAVAVPRLNASREDAELVKLATDIATLKKDILTYYTANGSLDATNYQTAGYKYPDLRQISSVRASDYEYFGGIAIFKIDGKECVRMTAFEYSSGEEVILMPINPSNFTGKCKEWLQRPEVKQLYGGHKNDPKASTNSWHNAVDTILTNGSYASAYTFLGESNVEF